MYEQFKTRAEGVSAEVYRFATRDEGVAFLTGFLRKEGVADTPEACALWAECPFLDGMNRDELREIAGLKFEVTREAGIKSPFRHQSDGMGSGRYRISGPELQRHRTAPGVVSLHHPYRSCADEWNSAGYAGTALQGESQRVRVPRHDYRAEPDSGYRAGADNRCAWS